MIWVKHIGYGIVCCLEKRLQVNEYASRGNNLNFVSLVAHRLEHKLYRMGEHVDFGAMCLFVVWVCRLSTVLLRVNL